jgi:hypothetical protein
VQKQAQLLLEQRQQLPFRPVRSRRPVLHQQQVFHRRAKSDGL